MRLDELAERLEKPFETVLVEDLGPQGGSAAYFINASYEFELIH